MKAILLICCLGLLTYFPSFGQAAKKTVLLEQQLDSLFSSRKQGSIQTGKLADLMIVSGKPDQNIEDIKNIEMVFKKGIGYDSKALRERAKGLVGRH